MIGKKRPYCPQLSPILNPKFFISHRIRLDSRNLCRDHCMDAVNIETEVENDIIMRLTIANNITGFWTSGRLCKSFPPFFVLTQSNSFVVNRRL